ncbi:MAG: hypothetical protein KAI84_09330 [Gammaproteobacteria bacterium]|nr:hypothetical protein [Gammaproteobacteria bacterium]
MSLISALADIWLRRYIEKNMSRPWRIEFKDTVPSSNLRELSETDINTLSTLKAQDFQKQYGKR